MQNQRLAYKLVDEKTDHIQLYAEDQSRAPPCLVYLNRAFLMEPESNTAMQCTFQNSFFTPQKYACGGG